MKEWLNRLPIRRFVFIFANVILCLTAIGLIGLPVHEFFAEREARIAEQHALLAKLSLVAGGAGDVSKAAQELDRRHESFLAGPNEGVISADLQTKLKRLAETAGARVRSVQGLPSVTVDQLTYSASRLEMVGSLEAVHRAIYAIENSKPLLFITTASVKISPSAVVHGKRSEEPVLLAQLDIVAAAKVSERAP